MPVNPATGRPVTTARSSGWRRVGRATSTVGEGRQAAVRSSRDSPLPSWIVAELRSTPSSVSVSRTALTPPANDAGIPARSRSAEQHLGGLVVAQLEDVLDDLRERGDCHLRQRVCDGRRDRGQRGGAADRDPVPPQPADERGGRGGDRVGERSANPARILPSSTQSAEIGLTTSLGT